MVIGKEFNYCIFGGAGFYEFAYAELKQYENVRYYQSYTEVINSEMGKLLYRLTFSPKINKVFKFPLKSLTFRMLSNVIFAENKPLCFLMFAKFPYHEWIEGGFVEFLKNKYPSCKIILYYQDLIKVNRRIKLEQAILQFDLILSYDNGDCHKYGLIYHQTPYSLCNIMPDDKYPMSDVFFCGKAKNRFDTIKSIYHKLQNQGLRCCFVVTEVPEDEQEELPGIIYSKGITYRDNICYELKTKCILEIMQDGATGFTPRVWESIAYEKHLLTNNIALNNSEFFNERYMHLFANLDEILNWINIPVKYSQDVKLQMSPVHLLEKVAVSLDLKKKI